MPSISLLDIPEEILLNIFLLGISEDHWKEIDMIPLNISHTNHALRQLTLSSPCLWTNLAFFLDDDDDGGTDEDGLHSRAACTAKLFELWIERSGNAMLNCKIEMSVFERMSERIFRLFLPEQWRWQSITLAFEYIGNSRLGLHFALTNMPNLQKLDLTFMADEEEVLTLDLSHSRQLQYLVLKDMKSRRWREITENIHGQQLEHLHLGLEDSPRDTFLISSLTMFPQLAHLDLRLTFNYGISLLSEMPNGSPILLPNLRVLKLGIGCDDLLNYFTAPSLVSLDIPTFKEIEFLAYEFIQRSKPSLEMMRWELWGDLDLDRIRSILQELYMVKTFILYHWDTAYTDTTPRLWQMLSIKNSDEEMLLPNLKELDFGLSYIYTWSSASDGGLRKLATHLVDMVLSRCQYARDFTLHLDDTSLGKALKDLETFERVQEYISNGCNVTIGSNRQKILFFRFR